MRRTGVLPTMALGLRRVCARARSRSRSRGAGSGLDLSVVVGVRVAYLVEVEARQQLPAFEVFDRQ
jgi:hypothetical protein